MHNIYWQAQVFTETLAFSSLFSDHQSHTVVKVHSYRGISTPHESKATSYFFILDGKNVHKFVTAGAQATVSGQPALCEKNDAGDYYSSNGWWPCI